MLEHEYSKGDLVMFGYPCGVRRNYYACSHNWPRAHRSSSIHLSLTTKICLKFFQIQPKVMLKPIGVPRASWVTPVPSQETECVPRCFRRSFFNVMAPLRGPLGHPSRAFAVVLVASGAQELQKTTLSSVSAREPDFNPDFLNKQGF